MASTREREPNQFTNMWQVKDNPVPPSGWHYMQSFQGKDWRLDSTTYDDLLADVLKFRLDHGMEVGSVLDDVANYICGNWPLQCNDLGAILQVATEGLQNPGNRRVDKVNAWVNSILPVPKQYVPQDTAQKRADICKRCPLNERWEHECPTCVTKTKQLLIIARGNRGLTHEKELQMCSAAGWCNRTAIWMEKEALGNPSAMHDGCWMKREDM